jgi:hypothetical protein
LTIQTIKFRNVLIIAALLKNMYLYTLVAAGIVIGGFGILALTLSNASAQDEAPKVTEIEIPGVLNLTLNEHNSTANLVNISYMYKGEEHYFLFNVTHIGLNDAQTADCIDKTSAMGEKNYLCVSKDPNDFTMNSLFCDTNSADCLQPSGRHKN